MLKLLRFLIGYVKIRVFGFAPERLMNLIINNDIVIWNVESEESGYTFYTGRYNLMKMKPFLHKTNMKFEILEKRGFPYAIKRNKRRVVFVSGFGLFCVILYVLSLFVWEVKIIGEDKLVADTILSSIENNYVPLGTLKSKVKCSVLEENLRKEFRDISWISCELKGTGLTVYLEEGIAPKTIEKDKKSGDIIASKDATITKMITREGTPIAKVKDKVKKGDILISGTIYIYDDNNEIMETSYIAADGDVYGLTSYQYEDYIDLKYYEKTYTDDSKEYVSLYVMKYCFTPYIPSVKQKDYDTYTEIHKAKIFHHFYLPFGYKKTTINPYELEHKSYTTDEAKKILKKRLNKKIQTFKEKGVEIIKNDVKIKQDGDRLIARGNITVKESIVSFKSNINTIPSGEYRD